MGSRPRRSTKGQRLMSNIFAHTRRIAAASAASMLIAGMAHAGTVTAFMLSAGVCIGIALSGTAFAVIYGALSRLVPPERRGWALGVAGAVGGLGQFTMVPAAQWLIGSRGWVDALLISALALIDEGGYDEHTLVDQAVQACKKKPKIGPAASGLVNAVLRRFLNAQVRPRNISHYEKQGVPAFSAAHGHAPQSHEEVADALRLSSGYRTWSAMNRAAQELLWQTAGEPILRHDETLRETYRRLTVERLEMIGGGLSLIENLPGNVLERDHPTIGRIGHLDCKGEQFTALGPVDDAARKPRIGECRELRCDIGQRDGGRDRPLVAQEQFLCRTVHQQNASLPIERHDPGGDGFDHRLDERSPLFELSVRAEQSRGLLLDLADHAVECAIEHSDLVRTGPPFDPHEIASPDPARRPDELSQRLDLPIGKSQRKPYREANEKKTDEEKREVEAKLYLTGAICQLVVTARHCESVSPLAEA